MGRVSFSVMMNGEGNILELRPRRSVSLRVNFKEERSARVELRKAAKAEWFHNGSGPPVRPVAQGEEFHPGPIWEALSYGLLWLSAWGVIALSFF